MQRTQFELMAKTEVEQGLDEASGTLTVGSYNVCYYLDVYNVFFPCMK